MASEEEMQDDEGIEDIEDVVVLSYLKIKELNKHSEKLVKGTEKLNCLTRWLFGSTVLLFIAAIAQLVFIILEHCS